MSRLALIYPKLAVFRSRKHLAAASTPALSLAMKPPGARSSSPVTMINKAAEGKERLQQLRQLSSKSSSNNSSIGGITKDAAPSEVIQRDLYELASKALAELIQSKNSSPLILEVRKTEHCIIFVKNILLSNLNNFTEESSRIFRVVSDPTALREEAHSGPAGSGLEWPTGSHLKFRQKIHFSPGKIKFLKKYACPIFFSFLRSKIFTLLG